VPDGGSRRFVVDGLAIAVFRQASRLRACKDRCPHMGAPLSWGTLRGNELTCSWHEWVFDLDDGRCVSRRKDWARVEIYPVRLAGEEFEVGLPEASVAPADDERG
jgi:nitrite reductase/ring-hydroxylating ferredoxin subunit